MVKVRLEFFGWSIENSEVPEVNGKRVLEVTIEDRSTINELLQKILNQYPYLIKGIYDAKSHSLNESINIFLNGELVVPREIHHRELKDGDVLTFLVLSGGG